ncbi:MAG: AAA family ATPase [Bacteroidota bacterium]
MAKLLQKALTTDLLQKGKYQRFLSYVSDLPPQLEQVFVFLEASPKQRYPKLTLTFDLVCFELSPTQWIGSVPLLEVEAAGESLEELKRNAVENVQLEFIRKKRQEDIIKILETQWFDRFAFHHPLIEAPFYSLTELEELNKKEEKGILAKIGTPLVCEEQELFGLKKEKDQLIGFFQEQSSSSIMLIGHPGTGKTTLIRELSRKLSRLKKEDRRTIWEFSAARLISRLSGMGSWEEGMAVLCKELQKKGDILYIPRLSELFEVGQYIGNSLSIAGFLQPYLRRQDIIIIGECTFEEASSIESRSPGYLAMFATVKISEQSPRKNKKIIQQKVQFLAKRYDFGISREAIKEAYRLMEWFRPYSGLPGKAIHFLDALFNNPEPHTSNDIEIGDIYEGFCVETGLPRFMIDPHLPLDEEELREYFQERIFGQNEAIHTIVDVLLSIKAAVIRRGKPLASLLFVGPTGVGKTEMAKVLANYLFGSRDRMLRFDMSEHSDMAGVLRLTGDWTGGDGLLTSAIRQHPFSVVLFDELEKAHSNFFDLLLQILGEGRLTDAKGRVADFSSTIIIMTSNIGARSYQTGSIGFVPLEVDVQQVNAHFTTEVQGYFRPELFNRLDRLIPFAPLSRAMIRQVLNREMQHVLNRTGIKGRKVELLIDDDMLDQLGRLGYDPNYGARYLQRTIQERFTISLAKALNEFSFEAYLEVLAVQEEGGIAFLITPKQRLETYIALAESESKQSIPEFAESASKARRTAVAIEDGVIYTAFLSDLHKSERLLAALKKKNREPDFWKHAKRAAEYQESKKLRQKFVSLRTDIQQIEIQCLQNLCGVTKMHPTMTEEWTAWSHAFDAMKIELIQLQKPEFNICTIGIYGNPTYLYSLGKIYEYIAKQLEWETKMMSIWKHPEHDAPIKEAYKPKEVPKNCVLRGIELEFKGLLPFLWLQNESGCHAWASGDKEEKYMIFVADLKLDPDSKDAYQTPEGFHRKSFFNKVKARRTYNYGEGFKDVRENFTARFPYAKNLFTLLSKNLQRRLDSLLIT